MSDPNRPLFEIQQFREFLEKSLNKRVLEYILKPLTKPGDNYGSIMQSVDIKVTSDDDCNQEEILHFVCKTPVTNPHLIEMFQPNITCVKETRFYLDIIPAMELFERILNFPDCKRTNAFIRCRGSRISLNSSATVADTDAVLLLDNIKCMNYFNDDRRVGFDFNTTLAVLKTLAQFHALCIAMRRMQPELFNTKLKPYLEKVPFDMDEQDALLIDSICNGLKYIDGLDKNLHEKIENQLKMCVKNLKSTSLANDTPFTTIVHKDLWCNNIMINRDHNSDGEIKVKIYDFQLYFYESFVHDLIFFLFTSVQRDDLIGHFKVFIQHYHLEFNAIMKLAKCPLVDYTFDKMWNEIQEKAKLEMLHAFAMSKIVTADENSAPSLEEVSPESFFNDGPPSKALSQRWQCIISVCEKYGLF